ncbi:DUF2716 domain-containing protein [Amycolatopsis nivea]|uniref:DUF2716 domain-containing protein n=1 Tax=Amycolatopsis nivea TaxID=1644109 RepID=UPI0003A1B94E|nr:DUF2716 domain-containing protein [Amycolatopsis nivea]
MADEPAWYWVHDKLRFWPSTFAHDWPGFHEPRPSAAWDLSTGEYDRASAEFRLGPYAVEEHDVARAVLAALQEVTAEDDWLWVLHWQHQSFKFWPHRMQQNAPWPVSVFPRGDYHLFLAADFSYGTLGHPWERTLCVFGENLLPAVEKHADGILTNQLRRDGQPSALTR